jgi:hypothetical protein
MNGNISNDKFATARRDLYRRAAGSSSDAWMGCPANPLRVREVARQHAGRVALRINRDEQRLDGGAGSAEVLHRQPDLTSPDRRDGNSTSRRNITQKPFLQPGL